MGYTIIPLQESEATGSDIVSHENVDYFFWVRTHGWFTKGIDDALAVLKKRGVPTFGYHLDLYLGLQREPQLHEYVTKLDYFFTVDKNMADLLNSTTNTKGYFMPAGCFEDQNYIAEPDYQKYPHEVIFTGAKLYHSEWSYRPKLIDWLHKTYGSRFAHYGNGGGKENIRGHELNVLYSSAKVVVGDTLCKGFDYPWYSSDRLFCCTGQGGFLIYPKIKGLEMFFTDGKEYITYKFGDFGQLKALIDYYLYADEERNAIRMAGFNRTKEVHLYKHRMASILETLEKEKADI